MAKRKREAEEIERRKRQEKAERRRQMEEAERQRRLAEAEAERARRAEEERKAREEAEADRQRRLAEAERQWRLEELERQRRIEEAERQRRMEEAERGRRAEEERKAREQAESERRRIEEERQRMEAERMARNRKAWEQRSKLVRCLTEQSHVFPTSLAGGPCPICGRGDTALIDALTGWSESTFLQKFALVAEFAPPHAPLPDEEVAALEQELDTLLAVRDYSGIGNLILECLLVPPQEREPRPSGLLLARKIDAIVAARFGFHVAVTYERPLRDVLLPPHLRCRRDDPASSWEHDTFQQLMIFAHVLGATWQSLPRPYDTLRLFYRELATRQAAAIDRRAAERGGLDKILTANYPPDIQQLRLRLLNDNRPSTPITEDDE